MMNETPLNLLKNKAKSYASLVRNRVDVSAEEAKLANDYRELGKKVYAAVLNDLLASMKNDSSVVELIGSIEERLKRISQLKG